MFLNKMFYWLGIVLTYLLTLEDCTESLRLLEARIPTYVINGSTAKLDCIYDLDGESLYSIKWYKDGNEFYRYVPQDIPPVQIFQQPGVYVDSYNSHDAVVTLRNIVMETAGRYRCEVSGEAPAFQTVTEQSDLIVVSLPEHSPPKIFGFRANYQIGDWINVNCTTGRSKPATQLAWFINGEPADTHALRHYPTTVSKGDGLEMSVLGLLFRVEQQHFRYGDMKLKCVATISTFYWRSREESIELEDATLTNNGFQSYEIVFAGNAAGDGGHAVGRLILLLLAMLSVIYCW